jgi:hypothetical protein
MMGSRSDCDRPLRVLAGFGNGFEGTSRELPFVNNGLRVDLVDLV